MVRRPIQEMPAFLTLPLGAQPRRRASDNGRLNGITLLVPARKFRIRPTGQACLGFGLRLVILREDSGGTHGLKLAIDFAAIFRRPRSGQRRVECAVRGETYV